MNLGKKIVIVFEKLKKNLSVSEILRGYAAFLKTFLEILRISKNFLFSVFNIFKDLFNLDFMQILKLMTVFAFYSKMILIVSSVVPVSAIFVGFATEYWGLSVAASSGILNSIKEIIQIFYDERIAMQLLEEERTLFREFLSKHFDLLNQQRKYIKELQESHDAKLRDFQGELQLKDDIHRKLSLENSELTEKVKLLKLTTSVEKTEKFVMIGGNLVFIAIQCLNAYNRFTQAPSIDPNELKQLLTSLRSLINHLNTERVNRTAAARAASQSGTATEADPSSLAVSQNRLSSGLTGGRVDFDDEFSS